MDRNYDDATRFAIDILRKHPQISYEHAVAAAEHAGVTRLPRGVFEEAVVKLGILRQAAPSAPSTDSALSREGARLVSELEHVRQQVAETAELRQALQNIRRVVRSALSEIDDAS